MAIPAKRPSTVQNDDDVEEGSSQDASAAVKRIKRERGSANGHSRGPSKTPRRSVRAESESENGSSEYESSFEAPSDDEDETPAFNDDEANLRAYREAKEKGGDIYGWASDAGTIKQVILIDFMCHKHFSVELGNRMNFIVGHNGSGKSAVLTAIAVALGGKAAITGRGQGLKDMIRRDADKAVVTIIMSNDGPEAFKPEVYGSQIVIERTLNKNGSSGYKFRATREGRIIAHKREELNEICQNFNITIDSPLTILTQDNARSFLQNATDEALYKFFLEGTQLESLWATYDKLSLQADQLLLQSTRQKEMIPDKEMEVDQLHRKAQASQKIIQLQRKITSIDKEMAWAYIRDKENEMEESTKKYDELAQKVETVKETLKACQDEHDTLDGQVKEADTELKTFESGKAPLEQRQKIAKKKLGAAEGILAQTKSEIKRHERQIRDEKNSLAQIDRQIAQKQTELNQAESEQQRDVRVNLEKHRDLVKKLKDDAPRKEKLLVDLTGQLGKIDREIEDLRNKHSVASGRIQENDQRIESLHRQSGNRLHAFGQGVDLILRAIDRPMRPWVGKKPIGPIGLHVNLLDQRFSKVVHSILGNTLCSFVVTTPADSAQMLEIFKKIPAYKPPAGQKAVIRHSGDQFDWTRGDLRGFGPTMLSKLQIDNDDVTRVLINQHRIEQLFVSPSLLQANKELDELKKRGLKAATIATNDHFRTNFNPYGTGSGPFEEWRGNPMLSTDLADEIAQLEREKQAEMEMVGRLDADLKDAQDRRAAKQAEVTKTDTERRRVANGIINAERAVLRLESQIEERPDNAIGGLEMSKAEHEKGLETAELNLKELQAEMVGHEESIQKLNDEHEELKQQIAEFGPEGQKRRDALTILGDNRSKARGQVRHWEGSLATYTKKLEEQGEDKARTAEELEDWTQKATDMHGEPRVQTRRSIDDLRKDKENMVKAKKEAEKRQGVTAEDFMPAYQKAKAELEALVQQTQNLEDLAKYFKMRVRNRRRWWSDNRDATAIRARTMFIINLENRNLAGVLDFDHKKKKLAVRIFTTGQARREAAAEAAALYKVPKNLSGGERSFSTVSLLLSLWDTASCPIRCLDEWDVFLDAGNRGVAAKMLVEGARESGGKQFILITPLDLHGVRCEGPGNKQIRLDDPVRNQSTLNFAPA